MRVLSAVICAGLCLCAGLLCAQDLQLQPAPPGTLRFKDIEGQAYGANFVSTYTYASASVTLSVDPSLPHNFSGTLTASGLKPNFAYQLKLAGRPSKEATTPDQVTAADDATNERLGLMGRWWRAQPNPGNSDDTDYMANKDTPGYIYEGYLIIGFFVTNAQGAATLHFDGTNSFHVLWRTDQRPATASDGPPLAVTIPDTTGNPAYDAAVPARQATLYGEWQPTRAAPGTLQMTLGHYRCDFVLTEESFHDSGPLAGGWSAALRTPVEFDIPTTASTPPPPPPPPSASPLNVISLQVQLSSKQSNHDWARVTGTLTLPSGIKIEGLLVQANLLGATRAFTLNARGLDVTNNGWFSLLQDRPRPSRTKQPLLNSAHFMLSISKAAFVLPPAAQPVPIHVALTLGTADYAGTVSSKSIQAADTERLTFRR